MAVAEETRDALLELESLQVLHNRARQLYKNISMLFLFPVKDSKLSTGVKKLSMQHLMHHVTVSLQQSKITLQNNCINNTSITQLMHFVLLFVTKNVEFATFTQTVMIRTVLLNTGSSPNIE